MKSIGDFGTGARRLALPALLADADVGLLLLRPLTVKEAGRLSGACRTALALVRRGEASEAETGARVFRPMWNMERTLPLLQRYRPPFFPGWLVGELESLARLVLDELVPAGIVAPSFRLNQARNGQPPSLLGCHELRVEDPQRWVLRLQEWALTPVRTTTSSRRRYPGLHVSDLLHDMGLMGSTRDDFSRDVALALHPSQPACLCVRMWVRAW